MGQFGYKNQFHLTSSPVVAPFKVLLQDQKRIACMEFQWRLLLSVYFLNILSLKVAMFFWKSQRLLKQLNIRTLSESECAKNKKFLGYIWQANREQ